MEIARKLEIEMEKEVELEINMEIDLATEMERESVRDEYGHGVGDGAGRDVVDGDGDGEQDDDGGSVGEKYEDKDRDGDGDGDFLKLRRPVGSTDLHRPNYWHQILRFGRSVGHQKTTRGAPMISPIYCKTLPRGYLEVLGQLWGVQKTPRTTILDTFIVLSISRSVSKGPQVTIDRPCQRFRAFRRGTREFSGRVGRG